MNKLKKDSVPFNLLGKLSGMKTKIKRFKARNDRKITFDKMLTYSNHKLRPHCKSESFLHDQKAEENSLLSPWWLRQLW